MSRALVDRVLLVCRFALYAVIAAHIATTPERPATIGLLETTEAAAPALIDPSSQTLGWLSHELARAIARTAGIGGLCFATSLTVLLTMALMEWRARTEGSRTGAFAATLIGATCLLDLTGVGDGVCDALCFAALLMALSVRGRVASVAIGVITALWCNLSVDGVLAPLVIVVYGFGRTLNSETATNPPPMGFTILASLIGTFCTPALLLYPIDASHAIANQNIQSSSVLTGLQLTPSVHSFGWHAALLVIVAVFVALAVHGDNRRDSLIFALTIFCGVAQHVLIPFIGIAATPLLARSFSRMFEKSQLIETVGARIGAYGVPAVVIALGAGQLARTHLPDLTTATVREPFRILGDYAHSTNRGGKIFCPNSSWCDVAEHRYGLAVLADSHVPSAPDSIVQALLDTDLLKKGWQRELERLNVQAIFLDRRSGLATVLAADGWQPFESSAQSSLLIRSATTR
jgi:hypothetical protein